MEQKFDLNEVFKHVEYSREHIGAPDIETTLKNMVLRLVFHKKQEAEDQTPVRRSDWVSSPPLVLTSHLSFHCDATSESREREFDLENVIMKATVFSLMR